MSALPPSEVAAAIRQLLADNSIGGVVIQNHYGTKEVQVAEVWESKGTIHISIIQPVKSPTP